MKITQRDVRVFILGMVALLAIESAYNWKQTKEAFLEGYNQKF